MSDFPAAHSMDTDWFAVDADGNIGFFDSSEGGAVPETWRKTFIETKANYGFPLEYAFDLFDIWRTILSCNILILRTPGSMIGGMKRVSQQRLEETRASSWVFRLSSDRDIDEVIGGYSLRTENPTIIFRFSGDDPVYLIWKNSYSSKLPLLKQLIRENKVIEGKPVKLYHYRGENHLGLLGLYPYAQDSSAPIPYEKMSDPLLPLNLNDLPEQLQDTISWTWFENIHFSETQSLQPIEHMKCKTWKGTKWWTDSEGCERDGHPH